MYLYCRCGHPLLVTATWTGMDYFLVLRDGQRGKGSPPMTHCPQCGQGLAPEDMEQHPPSVLRWHPKEQFHFHSEQDEQYEQDANTDQAG